jgi:hypothetical protein
VLADRLKWLSFVSVAEHDVEGQIEQLRVFLGEKAGL